MGAHLRAAPHHSEEVGQMDTPEMFPGEHEVREEALGGRASYSTEWA